MIGSLNKTDAIIRSAVRNWLNLPKDTPNAFFHAPISHGGLGIPAVRWIAPWLRMHCLETIELPNQQVALAPHTFLANEIDKAKRRLLVEGQFLLTRSDIDSFWSTKLHATVDGASLREASDAPYAHRWIREPSKLLSGRDFINCLKLRINALPSKSRTTRGRARLDRQCRGGCDLIETTNHILQGCHRTHGSRVERHDSVVKFIKRSLDEKGWATNLEPRLSTSAGIRKPDLIAITENVAVVVDAHIVTDGYNINEMHNTKVRKYNTDEIKSHVMERFNVSGVVVTAATLNWRGIWAKQSINKLLTLGVLKKNDAALISTRVAIGGVRSFRIFNNLTTVVTSRTGVG
jgi:CxxC motif-containing protein